MYVLYTRIGNIGIFCSLFRWFLKENGDGMGMRENVIERLLTVMVKKMGGKAVKFISPGLDGVPDRLVLLPGGRCGFVELKAPGKKMRPLQVKRKKQLENLGFSVYMIDEIEKIGGMLDEIENSV